MELHHWIIVYLVVTGLMVADYPRDHYGRFSIGKAVRRALVAQLFLVVLFLGYWILVG